MLLLGKRSTSAGVGARAWARLWMIDRGDPGRTDPARRHLRHLSHGQYPLHRPAGPGSGQNPGPGGQQRPDLRVRINGGLFYQWISI